MGEWFATTGPGHGGPGPSRCWRCWPPWSRRPGRSRPRRRAGRASWSSQVVSSSRWPGSSWLFHQAFVAMLGGGRQPAWSVLLQLALVLVGFAALSYDPRLGTALLAGLFGAMFAVNLWAMRKARGNRAAVDAQEAAAEQVRVAASVSRRSPSRRRSALAARRRRRGGARHGLARRVAALAGVAGGRGRGRGRSGAAHRLRAGGVHGPVPDRSGPAVGRPCGVVGGAGPARLPARPGPPPSARGWCCSTTRPRG